MTKCIDCNSNVRYDADAIPCTRQEGVNDTLREGYLCSECQKLECDVCHNKVLDYELEDGQVFCIDCMEAHNE